MKKEFYQHYITDWMDSTEGLDDGAYRVFHVVIQMIYQHGGPVKLSERGLAGRCNQPRPTFRKNLETLIAIGKLELIDGKYTNKRAQNELERREEVSKSKAEAGKLSGASRRSRTAKPLADNESARTDVQRPLNQEKRKEEKREDENLRRAARLPDDWKPLPADREEAKRVLGSKAGREFNRFCDHWRAQPGQRGVKVDWNATWRNWVRKAADLGNGKNERGGSLLDAIDRKLEAIDGAEEADLEMYPDHIQRLPKGSV